MALQDYKIHRRVFALQYSRRLDPRFFCFSELGQGLLVPGAKVTPNFGWSREPVLNRSSAGTPRTPSKPRAGKGAASAASATSAADQPPFVAWRLENTAASQTVAPAPDPSGSEDEETEPGACVETLLMSDSDAWYID